MSNQMIIQFATIYTENDVLEDGHLFIKDGKIATISKDPIQVDESEEIQLIDGKGLSVIPGFIDSHIHGAQGADMMDATENALDTIASALPKEGTTSFLATTITQSTENIEKALHNVAIYENKHAAAELIGVHLEGPFINKEKKGAQPERFIMNADLDLFQRWQNIAAGKIKTVTVAPECDDDGLISYLAENGYNVSAGHSSANFAQIKEAAEKGVHQLTHLCNAMTGLHHRDIGAVGAAFIIPSLLAEVIADEIHLSPEMLQLVYKNIGSERLILITDSMRAKALGEGNFELGGQKVEVKNNKATLQEGTLAGSILKMDDAVQNMLKIEGVSIRDIIQMASVNPAKQIHLFDQKGSIKEGKDADILLVNDELNIKYTICRGMVAYEEGIE
ncbi:N-acetylglucosamine-6-phosphate deacetylase [Pseudogracilibacillus auburnensis]|uniref:N-acetylglucosamine-6-phosphate deacetylase n=1 Tax=Pseudogracilibacillus auburnensis TaxID=1494959 RepID=A0A2V3WDV3_9BACI|nr:N-acetylglucosamine-6-phosphate deacetylase [Pseudogracilibacillus auburnensis]MBO1005430.1 N-acetylglucosamine-6-phosphate deacetylase [Pseudogracilibacillus auburnensis]PXW90385.1 N-acetylglucosamine 6-phosphate deacetylase [Pseudogracilibacillus auburnensis]